MAITYDRTESENEIIITLKYHAAVYILLFCSFTIVYAGAYMGIHSTTILLIVYGIIGVILAYSLAQFGVTREVRKAMKTKGVQVSGSKFSFSHPITYRIKK